VTTLPPATIACLPIVTPAVIILLAAIHALSSIIMGATLTPCKCMGSDISS